jgi:hypothetical protein
VRAGIEVAAHGLEPFPEDFMTAHNHGAHRDLAGLERRAAEG